VLRRWFRVMVIAIEYDGSWYGSVNHRESLPEALNMFSDPASIRDRCQVLVVVTERWITCI
jgi:hypothetical protein